MIPLTVKRNDYNKNKKNSTIYTPKVISEQIYDIICGVAPKVIFDPSIGHGSLTNPWRNCAEIIGADIDERSKKYCDKFIHTDFEDLKSWDFDMPDLILCNPPFNKHPKRKLYSEVFLRKIVELFGASIPIVLFVPMGFRLNQKKNSKRRIWLENTIEISSILSLPYDCFEKVKFHTEVLVFNVDNIKPHYFI